MTKIKVIQAVLQLHCRIRVYFVSIAMKLKEASFFYVASKVTPRNTFEFEVFQLEIN
jgi:hypothetical protein